MNLFRLIRRLFLVVAIISSIGMNVAFFVSSTAAMALSGLFQTATGLTSVVGGLSETIKAKNSMLKVQGNKLKSAQKTVTKVTQKINRRATVAVARNVGSLPAEAIPIIGASVIIGVTALDVYDACETMKDMRVLNEALGSENTNEEEISRVCGTEIPSVSAVWSSIENGTHEVWRQAKNNVPSLPDFQTIAFSSTGDTGPQAEDKVAGYYITFDRAQNSVIKVVSGTRQNIENILDLAGASIQSLAGNASRIFHDAIGGINR